MRLALSRRDDACADIPVTLGGGSPRGQLSRHTTPVLSGYSNTAVTTLHLVSDAEHSLLGLAEYNDAHVWGVFTRLGLAVREGAGQARGALGVTEEEEHLSQVL